MAASMKAVFFCCFLQVVLFRSVFSSVKQHATDINSLSRYTLFGSKSDIFNEVGRVDIASDVSSGPQFLWKRKKVAEINLARFVNFERQKVAQHINGDDTRGSNNNEASGIFNPGDPAQKFTLPTLAGQLLYPGDVISAQTPVLLHAYSPHSAFLQCVWNCSGSLEALIEHSPNDTHYIFLSHGEDALTNSLWMRERFTTTADRLLLNKIRTKTQISSFLKRLHFVTAPLYELGNWLPTVFKQWTCPDHNCGLDQAMFQIPGRPQFVLPRLDARYDWLPVFQTGKTFNISNAQDGCADVSGVKGKVALVTDKNCPLFKKILTMKRSGAVGVIIVQTEMPCPQDINCANQSECSTPINIPVTMVTPLDGFSSTTHGTVSFQNTPWDNFFFGIDRQGRLIEVGWLLYPSFHFLAWQAQWVDFKAGIQAQLREDAFVISVLNDTTMQGSAGASANITLPSMSKLAAYSRFELDMSLSCPGSRDTTCPHWDHTVQLFVCCDTASPRCGMELGRWISPFRRRIGRWLTDVTSLLPLLDGQRCTFTMKTVPWAMPWKPSLNLRFSGLRTSTSPHPYMATPLYSPGATFDIKYNTHFLPYNFEVSPNTSKVEIVSVITGHGSDENGCGEFCVTSHHFVVNDSPAHNKTFDNAGTPLGCADRVPEGVEPNEHGTWLYGRDGWCDGQQVSPWVIDITHQINKSGVNTIRYFGWFQGKDPNPKSSPGIMTVFSYLVFYKD